MTADAGLLLGVDGGGTKTIAIVADASGRVLGAARGPGSNWTGEDPTAPMAVVAETARDALRKAGAESSAVGWGVFALAGVDWPEDHLRREAILRAAGLARRVIVKNDTFAALRAGSTRPYGIAVIAGTERNAAAIAPDGREVALGYYASYGGARTIAAEVVEAVVRAEAGLGPSTALTPIALEQLGYPSIEAMFKASLAGGIAEEDLLRLCPPVFGAATAGDAVAAAILVRHGRALAEYVIALAHRFDMQALDVDIVLSGGVFRGDNPLLVEALAREIAVALPFARIVRSNLEPIFGSLMLAFDAAGIPVSLAIRSQMIASGPSTRFFSTADGRGYRPISSSRGA